MTKIARTRSVQTSVVFLILHAVYRRHPFLKFCRRKCKSVARRMANSLDLFREYLLILKKPQAGHSDEEDYRGSFDVDGYVRRAETWKIFTDAAFDVVALKAYFNSKTDSERSDIFKFGVACLISFVQANFTGPPFDAKTEEYLGGTTFAAVDYAKMLSMNNEDINCNAKHPVLLVTAKIVFEWCIVQSVVNIWWYWRALYLHQQILEELSPTLLSDADRLYKLLQVNFAVQDSTKVALDIEVAQLYLLFRQLPKAKEHIMLATGTLRLKYDYVGALGKRTRFQEKEVPQLLLKSLSIGSEERELDDYEVDDEVLPKNLPLNDEVLLEDVSFANGVVTECAVLPNLAQKLLLTVVQEMLVSKPQDELHAEELQPIIQSVLAQRNSFCVRVVALLLRCKLESKNRRTVERALTQCEEVLHAFRREKPDVFDRAVDVFGCGVQPIWKVENQYADLLLLLGLVKNALEVYLRCQLWEDVIVCYTILQLKHKAAEVVRKQLELKPTVKLWCLLGDTTDDVTCYERAWELSKRRSHRAQRHWGLYLYLHKEYEECIPHFEKSVSINPLQSNVWFRLGYAALQTENWQTAATAYKRYTTLEPDGYEAWNNLAQAYLKLGNKRSAHQALLEAVRCNFEHWKVWENFLEVSSDISMYSDVIRAYHRLLDLKEKYLNVRVLVDLVYDMIDHTIDYEGLLASRFLPKTRELLGRVLSIYPAEAELWDLYAKVAPTTILKAQRYQRAYKAYTSNANWVKDLKTCREVIYVCFKLAEIAILPEMDTKNTLVNSIKLNISSAMAALKKQDLEDTRECVEKLSSRLEPIVEKLKNWNAK
ncbi:tetratricopeptide repeat protein 27 [Cylas formicarius]|uniref:tetratricopeptide repeat protein 27 n=1 Tax=Cylas formicarius TaxID=197179 RepID=UPI002958D4A0|nr:tetratricopeptide repeat protein 27 [Cylas formicarius]